MLQNILLRVYSYHSYINVVQSSMVCYTLLLFGFCKWSLVNLFFKISFSFILYLIFLFSFMRPKNKTRLKCKSWARVRIVMKKHWIVKKSKIIFQNLKDILKIVEKIRKMLKKSDKIEKKIRKNNWIIINSTCIYVCMLGTPNLRGS